MEKQVRSLALFATVVLFLASCKGEQGSVGTANVQQINFAERTHTGITDLFLGLPAATTVETVEKSLVHIYVKQTVKAANRANLSYWFAIPGETSNGNEYGFYIAFS